jgi:hypothetical protein
LNHFFASSILMVRPASFSFNEQTSATNSFQQQHLLQTEVSNSAIQEFDAMVILLRNSGIQVKVIQDQPNPQKPDAIFPNNWFSTHLKGKLVLYPMFAENRRLERDPEIIKVLTASFSIQEVIDITSYEGEQKYLEGTGSIVFDHKNKMAFACRSPRTSEYLLGLLCEKLGYEFFIFDALDRKGQPIYHTNVLMCFLPGKVVICMESISWKDRKQLVEIFHSSQQEILEISIKQMEDFAGNMLCLQNSSGEYFLVLSARAYGSLQQNQISILKEKCELLKVNIPVIETIGGGGVRCMMAEIFSDPN